MICKNIFWGLNYLKNKTDASNEMKQKWKCGLKSFFCQNIVLTHKIFGFK